MTQIPATTDPGATLKRLREAKGLTQQALADKLGRSRSAVAAWEYGRPMSISSRAAVAKLLGVPVDTLGPPWNPHGARPQHGRRQRQERDYMATLRELGNPPSVAGVDPDTDAGVNFSSHAASATPTGGKMPDLPSPDLFQKVMGIWLVMDDDERIAWIQQGWTLANPGASRSTGRGKAQG